MAKNDKKTAKKQKSGPTHDVGQTTAAGLRPGDVVVRKHRGKSEPHRLQDVRYTVIGVTHFRDGAPVDRYLPEPDVIQCEVMYPDGAVGARRWSGPISLNTQILIRRPKGSAE